MKKINIRRLIYRIKKDYINLNNAVILIALVIAANWAWGALQMMQRNFALQKEMDDKSRQLMVAQLDLENAKLQQRYYQTDEYKELAVRERLGLVAPGEKLLVLPANSQTVKDADRKYQEKKVVKVTQPSNFNQWTDFLSGKNSRNIGK
jgi:hypothetical protein